MKYASIIPVLATGILAISACSQHQEPTLTVLEAEIPPPPPPPEPVTSDESIVSPIFLAWEEPPEVITRVMPQYPKAALEDSLEGKVILMIVVDEEGNVIKAQVVTAVPPDIFNEAAMEAILQWKFRPAKQRGIPIKVRLAYPVEFTLAEKKQ